MSLRDKAAIVGVGCTHFMENWTSSAEDMIVDAVYEAYADAGIEDPNRQIDAVFCGSLYSAMGPVDVSEALKLYKPLTSVYNYCATGTGWSARRLWRLPPGFTTRCSPSAMTSRRIAAYRARRFRFAEYAICPPRQRVGLLSPLPRISRSSGPDVKIWHKLR